jgi:peptidoglycan-associated lipoprotein
MKKSFKLLVFVFVASGVAFLGCAPKQTVDSEAEPVTVVEVEESVVITNPEIAELATVNFDFDRSSLSNRAQTILRQNAQYLLANPNANITVEGNCDSRGTVAYNLALGQRRADSVKAFYVSLGVNTNRIKTISYGKEKPLVNAENEAAWAANRRADTKLN